MPDFPKDPSKYDIRAAIQTVQFKLEHCASTKETTVDEMVRDFWAVVRDFPIPDPTISITSDVVVLRAADAHRENVIAYRQATAGGVTGAELRPILHAVDGSHNELIRAVVAE